MFDLLPPKLNLRDFLKTGGTQSGASTPSKPKESFFNKYLTANTAAHKLPTKDGDSTLFILRGFITFYGLHYISYFYSEKFDTWYQFNDENISAVGSFKDVRKKCIAGRQKPTTVFYERSDIITSVLLEQSPSKVFYFNDEALKENNFWIYGSEK